jgi:hypothetical protein
MSPRQNLASVIALQVFASMTIGCDDDPNCRVPLRDCDTETCYVVQGLPVNANGTWGERQPAGCWPRSDERITPPVETGGRAPDGQCWIFSDPLVPYGFVVDESCEAQPTPSDAGAR